MNLRLPIIVLCLIAAFGAPARAQEDYVAEPPASVSTAERIGFAYYFLTNQDPPYYDWIKTLDVYKKASDAQRIDILEQEGERLTRARQQILPTQDVITLQWFFSLKQMAAPATHRGVSLSIPNQSLAYLPVQVGRKWIAMIPGDMKIPDLYIIDTAIFDRLQKDYGINPDAHVPVVAEISLRPVQADKTKPMSIDGMELWLMMTDIVSLSILDSDMKPVWTIVPSR